MKMENDYYTQLFGWAVKVLLMCSQHFFVDLPLDLETAKKRCVIICK